LTLDSSRTADRAVLTLADVGMVDDANKNHHLADDLN
jgi:hypothetical protein